MSDQIRTPARIQLSRQKGYRKPEGAIVVARPSKLGNPYKVGAPHPSHGWPMLRQETVRLYRRWLEEQLGMVGALITPEIVEAISELRAHDLACWCPLNEPCHADVLLEIANA